MKRFIAVFILCIILIMSACSKGEGGVNSESSEPAVPKIPAAFEEVSPYITYKFQWENYSRDFDIIFYNNASFVLNVGDEAKYTPENATVNFYKSQKSGYLYRIEFICNDGNSYSFDVSKKSIMVSDNKEFPGAYTKTVYTGGDYSPLKTYLPDSTSLHGLNFVPVSGGDNIISFSKRNFLITLPDGRVFNNDNANLSLSYDTTVNGEIITYIDVYESTDLVCSLTFKGGKFIYVSYAGKSYSYKVKAAE